MDGWGSPPRRSPSACSLHTGCSQCTQPEVLQALSHAQLSARARARQVHRMYPVQRCREHSAKQLGIHARAHRKDSSLSKKCLEHSAVLMGGPGLSMRPKQSVFACPHRTVSVLSERRSTAPRHGRDQEQRASARSSAPLLAERRSSAPMHAECRSDAPMHALPSGLARKARAEPPDCCGGLT